MKKWTLGLILSLMLVASGIAANRLSAQGDAKKFDVIAKKFSFEPGEITLKKGQPVVLVIKSADVAHGLRFRELNLDVKIDKGGTGELRFTPDKVGDFVGHCSVFCGAGHGEMTFTLHVTE